MLPVLFSIGKISVSSFGVMLALGFLYGVFLIWRLSRAWELNEEKILDLTLLTFLGGLFGSRLLYVLAHLQYFMANPLLFLLFNKVPGFSFWGALIGGWLSLYYFSRHQKFNFWQAADIASIGFLAGLIFLNLGCFLGSCQIGIQSSFLAVSMAGVLGKRFPVQALEAVLLFFLLVNLWSRSTKFHPPGQILSLCLIFIGLSELIMQPFKEYKGADLLMPIILFFLGIFIFYKVTGRKPASDLKKLVKFTANLLIDSLTRKTTLARLKKFWYNQKTSFFWKIRNLKKGLRKLNVKFSYKNNKLY